MAVLALHLYLGATLAYVKKKTRIGELGLKFWQEI
jgi:hypothetical protein